METGIIEVDARHTVRRMRAAMQGNVIKALVELITNSDDSYIRLEEDGKLSGAAVIEIIYRSKKNGVGLFAVRDQAEGMDLEAVRRNFKRYGAATSGMKIGKRVRGYFGQGAKDALAGMANGRICTFKDNRYVECRLYIEGDEPHYSIGDPVAATSESREACGIPGNGTIAYFEASGRVPRFDTVQEELANNHLLRKILMNSKRKVVLIDFESDERRGLRFVWPEGKKVLSDDFTISYGKHGDFSIHMVLMRSEKGELTQSGDNRMGGLLIMDEENAVLGISLFKFDNEPLASRFYGELRIGRFRALLEAEEVVLSEERDGLVARHPFCQQLIVEVEKRLESKVKEEALRKEREHQAKIDREEAARYSKAFRILNEIAEIEAQAVVNLGDKLTADEIEPRNGFCIDPEFAQITVGKRYSFRLSMKPQLVPPGSIVKVVSTHPRIRVVGEEIRISREDSARIFRKYITAEGLETNIEGKIKAVFGTHAAEAKVQVLPEKELLLSEGMVFQPETLTLHPNQARRASLVVYVKMIQSGSRIRICSDNETVYVSKKEVVVNEALATRGYAKYELEVWGEKPGESAVITAEHERSIALLEAKVVSKEDQEEKNRRGMFDEPEFSFDPIPLQRSSYSIETGKVILYVNFPSVQHYLGESAQFKRSLPAQVMIADLVSERCFFEIARKKVESAGTIRPEAVPDRIQRDANELSRKHGKKVHEILVDQDALRKSKSQVRAEA